MSIISIRLPRCILPELVCLCAKVRRGAGHLCRDSTRASLDGALHGGIPDDQAALILL